MNVPVSLYYNGDIAVEKQTHVFRSRKRKHVLPKQELFLLNQTTLLITGESRSMTLIIFSLLKSVNHPCAIEISLRIHQKIRPRYIIKITSEHRGRWGAGAFTTLKEGTFSSCRNGAHFHQVVLPASEPGFVHRFETLICSALAFLHRNYFKAYSSR